MKRGQAWPEFGLAIVLAAAVAWTAGCSSKKPSTTRLPGPAALPSGGGQTTPADPAEGFEAPPVFDAEEILTGPLYKDDFHRVDDDVYNFGYLNFFTVWSDFGEYDVIGEDMLRIRVQELHAIAALAEMSKTKQFGRAVKQAAKNPFIAAKNLIIHPVDTLSGVPKGMWRYMTRLGGMVTGKRGKQEESVAKELIMFSGVKRKLAYRLDVDVYSSNKELQKKLNSVSWAMYAGGMTVSVATFYDPAPVGVIVRVVGATRGLKKLLRDDAPDDLRRMNRKLLIEAGFDATVVKEFIAHRVFSPRHRTYIVNALVKMDQAADRDVFLRLALNAESEEDALMFQRMAEMMIGYHERVAPVQRIVPVRGFPVAYTAEQKLAVFLPLDYAIWTLAAAESMQSFATHETEGHPVKGREIWITGRQSPRAHREIEALGIVVHENAFPTLQPPPDEEQEEEEKGKAEE